jgi:uncharacterized protein
MKEQATIDSLEFAQKSHALCGTIAPRDLKRLDDILFSGDGEIGYTLTGGSSAQGKPEIRLHLQGLLHLACQRCMGDIPHTLNVEAKFVVVPSEDMMPAPEDEEDDIDYMLSDSRLDVQSLIEDEILLGLPMAPLHEPHECGVQVASDKEQKESPFKVLQGLKFDKR